MMNDLLIELDDFNKIKQAACFNKRSNMTNCYRSDNPFMQIIGQAGRCFPTQPINPEELYAHIWNFCRNSS